MLSKYFKGLKNPSLDDIINEDNRLKFEAYGATIPPQTKEQDELTEKYIRAIKESKGKITYKELEAIH